MDDDFGGGFGDAMDDGGDFRGFDEPQTAPAPQPSPKASPKAKITLLYAKSPEQRMAEKQAELEMAETQAALEMQGTMSLADQLFAAMDKDKDGELTKFEYLEFMREHKPKHGPYASIAKLQTALRLDHAHFITKGAFVKAVAKAEDDGLVIADFEFDFDDEASSPAAPKTQADTGGFQMWGAPGGSTPAVVIPPFVPRDQRQKGSWDMGPIKKRQSDLILTSPGASTGDYLIREMKTSRETRHVLCVRDSDKMTPSGPEKVVYETYIRHKDGGFLFSSRQFDTLADVIKHVQMNSLYNAKGLPLYIDKPALPL